MPLVALSSVLERERRLVEKGAREHLRFAELDRALLVHALTETYALQPDATLRELAARVPNPWRTEFIRHRAALMATDVRALPRSLVDFLR